ncbi:MAG: DUF3108 domain-containing protein [Lentisphaerae bacterium]|jgi:hypothetical protein|nr:DUF3108 domain-containing protein [Lentisphaerota bacterium]
MIKKWFLFFLVALTLPLFSVAKSKPDLWFPVGERMIFQLYWGVIPVGEAILWSEWIEQDGRTLLSIKITAKSNKILSKIYPVNDYMESIIDPESFLPISFFKNVSEGRYRLKEITTFDYEAGKGYWQHLLKDKSREFDIDPNTRDLITFMFYMRSQQLEEHNVYNYRVMADEKLYDLIVNTKEKEKIKLPAMKRSFVGLKCDPEASFQGLFVRVGKLCVWVSDDDRRIALKITARVPLASVQILLKRVEGPGDDEYIRASRKRSKETVTDEPLEEEDEE